MQSEFKDFYGNIQFKHGLGYQLLLASQLYGTNFSVFGKFIFKKDADGLEYLSQLECKVFNYKGLLDIGLSTLNEHKATFAIDLNNGLITIGLTLRAMVAPLQLDDNGIPFKPVAYKKTFNPDTIIKIVDAKYLQVERDLIPIAGEDTSNPMVNGVFDSEFFFRDGYKYAKRVVREIPDDKSLPIMVNNSSLEFNETNPTLFTETGPGKLCRLASFKVIK